ncbi:MAG: hypothetical protein JXB88_10210 [Spirochaetales bacterium]|nr:hypothetical protein [Spirochaetales bacterium]
MISVNEVRNYINNKYPNFIKQHKNDNFSNESIHYYFERFADYTIEYSFNRNNKKLAITIKEYILYLLKNGDPDVLNAIYV